MPERKDRLAPVELGEMSLRSSGTRRTARKASMTALQATGAFETVESARAALWKLSAADWVEAIAIGVRRRERTAMKLFAQACKMLGQEGTLIQAFVVQFGLGSIDDMRAALEHVKASRDVPLEQIDRDAIEHLEARGYRVLSPGKAVRDA